MITCRDFADLVTPYLEQELPLPKRAAMALHASICGDCRRYLDQLKLTVDDLHALRDGDVDAETKARLVALFRDRKSGR